ncbi:hypothetical protein SASPL_137592 [Salvia splendens]|uniref:Uncharacterized protein n=1 Tax=Salvia splendens TaxID=180675 RepID=A0A8X8WTL4_SALSN|nr:hypothetical protein SASPL_137592 [Salvia splendens]
MASLKQAQALAGGPFVQARNFAVMTGANAGISCVMKRLRGKDDVQTMYGLLEPCQFCISIFRYGCSFWFRGLVFVSGNFQGILQYDAAWNSIPLIDENKLDILALGIQVLLP